MNISWGFLIVITVTPVGKDPATSFNFFYHKPLRIQIKYKDLIRGRILIIFDI